MAYKHLTEVPLLDPKLKPEESEIRSPVEDPDKPRPIEVGVSLKVVRMLDIDPVAQTFKCDMFVKYEWEDPGLRGFPKDDLPDVDDLEGWKKFWDPKLTFRNAVELDELRFPKKVVDVKTGKVESEFFVVATFFQAYDLHLFPFDQHKLLFEVRSSDYAADKVVLKQHSKRKSVLEAFSLPAWSLDCQPPAAGLCEIKKPPGTASNQKYSYYFWTVATDRHYSAYLWNIGFLLFLISTLSVTAFFLPTEEVGSRSATMLTLVLTAVALKFVVNDNLPKISYLTILDYYIFLCFFVLYILTIVTTAATHFKRVKHAPAWNQWLCQGFLIVWLVIHVVLMLVIMWAYKAPPVTTEDEAKHGCCCKTIEHKGNPHCCVATPLQYACCVKTVESSDDGKLDYVFRCRIPRIETLAISILCTALVIAVVANSDLSI